VVAFRAGVRQGSPRTVTDTLGSVVVPLPNCPTPSDCIAPPPLRQTSPMIAVTLRDIHTTWAWFVIIANALVGMWALGAHWLAPLRLRALWWFVIGAEATIFVQVGLGVGMVAGQGLDAPPFHMFYGFVALITVALLYSYRQQLRAHMYLLYGLGSLFLMGLGIRAVLVGR
jgi:hypothetical protein